MRVTVTVFPDTPAGGVMLASIGGGGLTKKVITPVVVPPAVVTVMLRGPGVAVGGMVKVSVICESLTTTTVPAVMPAIGFTVVPVRFAPLRVNVTVFPVTPDDGEMPVNVGAGGTIVNVTTLLFPLAVWTEMFCGPSGPVNVRVIWVSLSAKPATLVAVTPVGTITDGVVRFAPLKVTVVPLTPDTGKMAASVGGGTGKFTLRPANSVLKD